MLRISRHQTLTWHFNDLYNKPRPNKLCLIRAQSRTGSSEASLGLALYCYLPGDPGHWLEQFDGKYTLPDDVVVEWAYVREEDERSHRNNK